MTQNETDLKIMGQKIGNKIVSTIKVMIEKYKDKR